MAECAKPEFLRRPHMLRSTESKNDFGLITKMQKLSSKVLFLFGLIHEKLTFYLKKCLKKKIYSTFLNKVMYFIRMRDSYTNPYELKRIE